VRWWCLHSHSKSGNELNGLESSESHYAKGFYSSYEEGEKLKEAIMSDIRLKSEALEKLILPDGAKRIIEKIEKKF